LVLPSGLNKLPVLALRAKLSKLEFMISVDIKMDHKKLKFVCFSLTVIVLVLAGGIISYLQSEKETDKKTKNKNMHFLPHKDIIICDQDFDRSKDYLQNFLRRNKSPMNYFNFIDPNTKTTAEIANSKGKTYISIFGLTRLQQLCYDWTRFFGWEVGPRRTGLKNMLARGQIDLETMGCLHDIEYHSYKDQPNAIRSFVIYNLQNENVCIDKALTYFFSVFVTHDVIIRPGGI